MLTGGDAVLVDPRARNFPRRAKRKKQPKSYRPIVPLIRASLLDQRNLSKYPGVIK